jgi:hypothetical protein
MLKFSAQSEQLSPVGLKGLTIFCENLFMNLGKSHFSSMHITVLNSILEWQKSSFIIQLKNLSKLANRAPHTRKWPHKHFYNYNIHLHISPSTVHTSYPLLVS